MLWLGEEGEVELESLLMPARDIIYIFIKPLKFKQFIFGGFIIITDHIIMSDWFVSGSSSASLPPSGTSTLASMFLRENP